MNWTKFSFATAGTLLFCLTIGVQKQAHAGVLVEGNVPGNVCTPDDPLTTGTGSNCVLDLNDSPVIARLEFDGEEFSFEAGSSAFPSIDGSEFDFEYTGEPGENVTASGTWFYNPGPGDPVITHFAAKGGPNYNLFENVDPFNEGDYFTPENQGGNSPALSNMVFFDQAEQHAIPEPITILGSLTALGFGGFFKVKYQKS